MFKNDSQTTLKTTTNYKQNINAEPGVLVIVAEGIHVRYHASDVGISITLIV